MRTARIAGAALVAAAALVPLSSNASAPPRPGPVVNPGVVQTPHPCLLAQTGAGALNVPGLLHDVAVDTVRLDDMTGANDVVAPQGSSTAPASAGTASRVHFDARIPARFGNSWFPAPYCVPNAGNTCSPPRRVYHFYGATCSDTFGWSPMEVADYEVTAQTKLPAARPFLAFVMYPLPGVPTPNEPLSSTPALWMSDLALPGECPPLSSNFNVTCKENGTNKPMTANDLTMKRCGTLVGQVILAFRPQGQSDFKIFYVAHLGGRPTIDQVGCTVAPTTSETAQLQAYSGASLLGNESMVPWALPGDFTATPPSMKANQPGTYRIIADLVTAEPENTSSGNPPTLIRQWPLALVASTSQYGF